MEKERTVEWFINGAGGQKVLASELSVGAEKEIHPSTVGKWIVAGIPEKHWGFFMQKFGASPDELHRINEKLREAKREV